MIQGGAIEQSVTGTPGYRHLLRLSDSRGIFEHARLSIPRLECGYCTDDNARLALVVARGSSSIPGARVLVRLGTRFVLDALEPSGAVKNRMSCRGRWEDDAALEDAWGRSVWALATVATLAHEEWLRREAMSGYELAVRQRSGFLRADVFAALGAAEMLRADPDHVPSRVLLYEVGSRIASGVRAGEWRWPEERLTYSNASLPEVMIAAGLASGDRSLLEMGLDVLEWLWECETLDGRLSVTPVGGRGLGDPQPSFDQQPIEVAALADACHRAHEITGSQVWSTRLEQCADWFLGANDSSVVMVNQRTGGGYDGLQPHGVNLNQGAESTLAMLSTLHRARVTRVGRAPGDDG